MLICLLGIREYLLKLVPKSVLIAGAAGIGVFISFVGLKDCGIISAAPYPTLVGLMTDWPYVHGGWGKPGSTSGIGFNDCTMYFGGPPCELLVIFTGLELSSCLPQTRRRVRIILVRGSNCTFTNADSVICPWLAVGGLMFTAILMIWNVHGAFIIGGFFAQQPAHAMMLCQAATSQSGLATAIRSKHRPRAQGSFSQCLSVGPSSPTT
jgi:AGZA family xanthine/uracil permease-like MFS transporter